MRAGCEAEDAAFAAAGFGAAFADGAFAAAGEAGFTTGRAAGFALAGAFAAFAAGRLAPFAAPAAAFAPAGLGVFDVFVAIFALSSSRASCAAPIESSLVAWSS